MNVNRFNTKLFSFLSQATGPYHAVSTIAKLLSKAGFIHIREENTLPQKTGQPYYLIREDGSLVAYIIGLKNNKGFRILGSHSDSPSLQIKPKPDLYENNYHRLAVEVYGGALLNPWFDRELSISGRATFLTKSGEIQSSLVDFKSPVAIIPSLAIHLDRSANKEKSVNPQKDIIPLVGLAQNKDKSFNKILKKLLQKSNPDIFIKEVLSSDLFFYDYHTPGYAGIDNDFIVSSRLDNLLSCFVAAQSMANADKSNNLLFICNNHEEIGSNTASGAQGNLLVSLFDRLFPDEQEKYSQLHNSFMLSIDNAHAIHPNFPDKHEPSHNIHLNTGPVLKINANQRYASTSLSNSIFKLLCLESGVEVQEFVMRSDMACGSTIGPMTAAKIGVKMVDIGAATLAMHSIREMTGKKDPQLIYSVVQHFLNRKEIPEIVSCD